ncbi:CubicO group peptidase (beta-lactamase class C family) [Pseudarthrobacter sp. W1I19]|nr:CubicO group peptidase (beta-lactamase class C family) [Pseudarthrobacter sp. W1I19]
MVFHVRNGDQEELRAAGVNSLESNKKAVPTDKMWIIGAGTSMVAVSVMKLVEAGTVRLDDPVSAHLPEFTDIFPASDRVTLRDLLGSTSGLPDYFPPLWIQEPGRAPNPPVDLRGTAQDCGQRGSAVRASVLLCVVCDRLGSAWLAAGTQTQPSTCRRSRQGCV